MEAGQSLAYDLNKLSGEEINKLSGEELNKLFALNFEADEFDEDDELDDYRKRLYLMMKKIGVYYCPH